MSYNFTEIKFSGREKHPSYKGVNVGKGGISLSTILMSDENIVKGNRARVMYDKSNDTLGIVVNDIEGWKITTMKTGNGYVGAKKVNSEFDVKGRYYFKEKVGDTLVFEKKNAL